MDEAAADQALPGRLALLDGATPAGTPQPVRLRSAYQIRNSGLEPRGSIPLQPYVQGHNALVCPSHPMVRTEKAAVEPRQIKLSAALQSVISLLTQIPKLVKM